jgi:hypothetical protein
MYKHEHRRPSYSQIKSGEYCRSPCPALNALANHSFISNDGKNLTIDQIADASHDVFGISKYVAKASLYLAKYRCGLKDTFTLADISGHNEMEHDVSMFHDDYFINKNLYEVSTDAVNDFIELAHEQHPHVSDSNEVEFTKETVNEHYQRRLDNSKKNNNFLFGWFQYIAYKLEMFFLFKYLVPSRKIKDLKTAILDEKLLRIPHP